ncbi:hypothetical protein [Desulfosporosinus sp. FKB]|uniref:hypothetical protein n=1 Tax=Desulfosporosinus sp. FKB TaxID=1969835 RepID=UPI000B49EC98|nr:hypothetical protein [Desulfosporosinus sp. FKB]
MEIKSDNDQTKAQNENTPLDSNKESYTSNYDQTKIENPILPDAPSIMNEEKQNSIEIESDTPKTQISMFKENPKMAENKTNIIKNKEDKLENGNIGRPASSMIKEFKKSTDLDMQLKIKFKQILWQMGHYARIDVKIAGYGEQEQSGRRDGIGELTDVDVLGINVHDDFQIEPIIVDCKNGENVSPSNRLYWLKGVMESLDSTRGYLVMGKKTIPSHLREVANKLNVSLMDGKNLVALERIYNINELDGINIFSEELFLKQEQISEKQIAELLNYRKYHYWISEDHTNLHNILSLLSKYADKLNPLNKNHQIIVMDLIILLTISIFKACSYVIRTSLSDVKHGVLLFLYNGIYNLDKYSSVLAIVDKIFEKTARNYDQIRKMIDTKPRFFDNLVELCITLLRRPNEAKDILRYMDIIIYSTLLPQKSEKKSIREVLGNDFNELTTKLMFDLFDFVEKTTRIDTRLIPRKQIYGD